MTIFKGMLLFDMAEPTINGWENQLGYRGMIEVWKKGGQTIIIQPDEDCPEDEDVWEVIWETEEIWECIDYGYGFDDADAKAKEYMREN